MLEKLRLQSYSALGALIIAKVFGIAGLALASYSRLLGGGLLAVDAVFIALVVMVTMRTMKTQAKEDDGQKAVLRQMMKEGTLEQYLRDIKAEEAKSSVE